MGGLTSSSSDSTKNTDSTTTTRPLPEQMPYLTKAWSQASDLLAKSNANPYTGHFVQAPNANQYTSFNDAYKWATGGAQDTANMMGGYGSEQLATGTAGQAKALGGLLGAANTDPTKANIDSAKQYASQTNVSDIVNASMRDAYRTASEQTLPSIYRNAAANGTINSDRTALAQGVVQRGLNDQASDLAATTRMGLMNAGLTNASAQRAQNLGALQAAGTLGSATASQGYSGSQAGFDNMGKSLTAQQAAAFGTQGLDQMKLDDQMKQWYAQYQQPWTNLQQYYGIVGDLKGGTSHTVGTETTHSESTPSALSSIGQGIGLFGSLFSDGRFKTIHAKIGTWNSVSPEYLYSYTFAPDQLHRGPIAQEVAAVRPDMVREVEGVLLIDTDKL